MAAALDFRNVAAIRADGVAQASLPAKSDIAGTEACATMRSARPTGGMSGGLSR